MELGATDLIVRRTVWQVADPNTILENLYQVIWSHASG